MSDTSDVKVTVLFDDLPDSAEVSGKAVKRNPPAFKDEAQPDTVVLEFRRKKLGEVREQLKGKRFDTLEITDIRFA